MSAPLRKPLTYHGSDLVVRISAREATRLGLKAGDYVEVAPAGPAGIDWEALPRRRLPA